MAVPLHPERNPSGVGVISGSGSLFCFYRLLQKQAGQTVVHSGSNVLGVLVGAAINPDQFIAEKDPNVLSPAFAFGYQSISGFKGIRPAIELLGKPWGNNFEHGRDRQSNQDILYLMSLNQKLSDYLGKPLRLLPVDHMATVGHDRQLGPGAMVNHGLIQP